MQTFTDTFIGNIEAEESILGGILLDPEALSRIVGTLTPEMFSLMAHQTIYKASLDLYSKHQPTDFLTVTSWLADRKLLDKVGGQSKLLQLVERTVSAVNIDKYAGLVEEKYRRRKTVEVGQKLIDFAKDGTKETEDIFKFLQSSLSNFTKSEETKEKDSEIKEKIEDFRKSQNSRLDLREVYPLPLAKALTHRAWRFPVHPEMIHHNFFALCAGLIGTRGSVSVDEDWTEPAVIYAATVCPSGSKKSPVLTTLKRPLVQLQKRAVEEYKENLNTFNKQQREWEKLTSSEKANQEPPTLNPMRHYYFEDQVLEQVMCVHGEEPSKTGFNLIYDELAELFNSLGQYKGGKGSERQILLRLWNGADAKRDRRSKDGSNFVDRTSVSIFGGIQDGIFDQFLSDPRNIDGLWARFLYINPPSISVTKRLRTKVNIDPYIASIYQNLDNLPPRTYRLSEKAKVLFDGFEIFVEDEKDRHNIFIQHAYTKMVSYLARFALILHCIDIACNTVTEPVEVIPEETMMRAMTLAIFYMEQVKLLFSTEIAGDKNISLPKRLSRIIQDYQHIGSVTHSEIRKRKWGDTEETKQSLLELERLGYGTTSMEGRMLKLTFFPNPEIIEDRISATSEHCPDWIFDYLQKDDFSLSNPYEASVSDEVGKMRWESNTGIEPTVSDDAQSYTVSEVEGVQTAIENFESFSHFPLPTPASEPVPESVSTEPEPTPEPETEPTPQPLPETEPLQESELITEPAPTPKATELDDRVYKKGELDLRKIGTIVHLYKNKKGDKLEKAMVDWDALDKKDPTTKPPSTVVPIKDLVLYYRKPRFESKPPEGKYSPGPIHALAEWQAGQTVLSKTGRPIGRVLKGKNAQAVIILDYKTQQQKTLSYDDVNTCEYTRAWILSPDWVHEFKVTDIKASNNEYFAVLRNIAGWRCEFYSIDNCWKTTFIAKEPKVYTYNSAQEWMKQCIEIFLKNEESSV